MNNWISYRLSDVINIFGGGTPKTTVNEYWNGDIPWLSVADFNNGNKYVYASEKTITNTGLNNSSAQVLEKGSIVISARGTVGVITMLGRRMTFNQSCYGIKAKKGLASNEFIYYLLKYSITEFLQISHGGVFNTITRDTFNEVEINLPPFPEQEAIAGVLSSLDDKIDLLQRENETLEALAETIFRQWFVEGAEDDWQELPLSMVADHVKENIKPFQNPDILFWHYSIPAFDDNEQPILEFGRNIRSSKYRVVSNSILISKLNPRFPRIWAVNYNDKKNSICSTEFQVVLPKKQEYFCFIYYFLKSKDIKAQMVSAASGTSGSHQRINPEFIFCLKFRLRDFNQIFAFNEVISAFIEKIDLNKEEILTLEKLRDTLLPKFMSGEVRVWYDENH